jgi:hypothetical protein
MVLRRSVPAVLVFAIAFAPVTLQVCQAMCATHAVASTASQHTHHHGPPSTAAAADSNHSHHHIATAAHQTGAAFSARHDCAHADAFPATVVAGKLSVHASATLPTVLESPRYLAAVLPLIADTLSPASAPLALNLPLRV